MAHSSVYPALRVYVVKPKSSLPCQQSKRADNKAKCWRKTVDIRFGSIRRTCKERTLRFFLEILDF